MGDRAIVEFVGSMPGNPVIARLYFHWDGSILPDLWKDFLTWNELQFGKDTRYSDMAYLATRFVAWYTVLREDSTWLHDGLSIGIDNVINDGVLYRVTGTMGYGIPAMVAMSE